MITTVLTTITKRNLINTGDKVVVALSGGVDSMSLLFFLRNILTVPVCAVHVNHMLRGDESEKDAAFVADYCNKNGVQLLTVREDVAKLAKSRKVSVEEAGRMARYKAYGDAIIKMNGNCVATAHTQDDAAETVIFNLARGAGINGLCGIPPKNGNVVRPFIDCQKVEIIQFARGNKIPYVTDMSNDTDDYTRNKIRRHVIPYIAENVNANAVSAIAATADIMREQADFMERCAADALNDCTTRTEADSVALDRQKLLEYHIAIQKLVLRKAVQRTCGTLTNIGKKHIDVLLSLLSADTGKSVNLPGGVAARTQYSYLVLEAGGKCGKNPPAFCYSLKTGDTVYIKEHGIHVTLNDDKITIDNLKNIYTKLIKCGTMFSTINLRTRQNGDKIRLAVGAKKLKDYFIDKKIPQTVRNSAIIIDVDGEIASVLGIVDSVDNPVNNNTKYIQFWEASNGNGND